MSCGDASAFPVWQSPPDPVSDTQPAVPAFCVSSPVVVLRSKTATAPELVEAT